MSDKGGFLIAWLMTAESWPKAITRGAISSLLVLGLATAVEFGAELNDRVQKNTQALKVIRKKLDGLDRVDQRLDELHSEIRSVQSRTESRSLANLIKRSQLSEDTVDEISELIRKDGE